MESPFSYLKFKELLAIEDDSIFWKGVEELPEELFHLFYSEPKFRDKVMLFLQSPTCKQIKKERLYKEMRDSIENTIMFTSFLKSSSLEKLQKGLVDSEKMLATLLEMKKQHPNSLAFEIDIKDEIRVIKIFKEEIQKRTK